MPWKECDKVSERMSFLSRLRDGERMTDLCKEFGISRVTGHKIWNRYKNEGLQSLNDRSKKPWRLANQTPPLVEQAILDIKAQHPTWGAPKIRAYLERRQKHLHLPARSTVHAILDRHQLVKKKVNRRRFKAVGTSLAKADAPNNIWCADFKGQFRMENHQYCYPLTITDQYSRYLLACEALESVREVGAIECFRRIFTDFGLPDAIRTDNGTPFSTRTLFGLSKLSVLWLRLGIRLERITPGRPEQNGQHERMHRTLKQTVTKPPGRNILHQQEIFDHFVDVFNQERPHEGIGMQCPSDLYVASRREYPKILEDYDYRDFEYTRRVQGSGVIRFKGGKRIFISDVFAEQEVGIKEVEDGIWAVNFMGYELGYFSSDTNRFNPASNPFIN
jgi:transposase InsO family protein